MAFHTQVDWCLEWAILLHSPLLSAKPCMINVAYSFVYSFTYRNGFVGFNTLSGIVG
jgi:hypothetical protein